MTLTVPQFDEFSAFAASITEQKYAKNSLIHLGKENWGEIALRTAKHPLRSVGADDVLIQNVADSIGSRKFLPGGRYLHSAGLPYHQTQNCLLMRAEDSREGWAELYFKTGMALASGAGMGVVYSDIRPEGSPIRKTGGIASGPIPLMQSVNEIGRGTMQGGSRRSAIWAGLHWNHRDIFKFIRLKDWIPQVRALKAADFNYPAPMDMTNISVILDDEFFDAYHNPEHVQHSLAYSVYWETVRRMLKTGEPGFSVDTGANRGENLRNACTEITSRDDSDICNLGSLNLARIGELSEFASLVEQGTAYLLSGTVYSDVPYSKVDAVRTKNRRLGLGLMGIHEWLLMRGKRYGPDPELTKWLECYRDVSDLAARKYADMWGLSVPVKTRAIAPNGTIGIVAETTTSGEPIFCVGYKRRYLKGKTWHYQYVIDPTAQRLIEKHGVDPSNIEDAYALAQEPERRVAFQAYLQQYVDHSISSTVNLPPWGSEFNNDSRVQDFGNMLMRYLPNLRGITCYPDGARGGQPLNPVSYRTAVKHVGKVFIEEGDALSDPDFGGTVDAGLSQSVGGAAEMTDAEAAAPIDVCDLTKAGSCG